MKTFNVTLNGSFILNGVQMDFICAYTANNVIKVDYLNNATGEVSTALMTDLAVDTQISALADIERATGIELDFRNIAEIEITHEDRLEQYLHEHNRLSLYGEYEQEDADGCFTMVLECAYMNAECVMVQYEKQITNHEYHSTETDTQECFFCDLDEKIQNDIISILEEQ